MTLAPEASERALIIATAYELLAASDGASASITDILTTAKLSTRAFYRHFGSKDDLLTAMFRRDSERVLEALAGRSALEPTGRSALRTWVTEWMALGADPRRRRRALVLTSEEVTRARGFRDEQLRGRTAEEAALADLLLRGRDDGSLPLAQPQRDAPHVRSVLHQALERQMRDPRAPDLERSTAGLLDFLLRALGGPGTPSGP